MGPVRLASPPSHRPEAQLIEEYRRLRKAERRKERRVRKLLAERKLFTLTRGPLRRGSIATAQAQYEREQDVAADYLRTGNLERCLAKHKRVIRDLGDYGKYLLDARATKVQEKGARLIALVLAGASVIDRCSFGPSFAGGPVGVDENTRLPSYNRASRAEHRSFCRKGRQLIAHLQKFQRSVSRWDLIVGGSAPIEPLIESLIEMIQAWIQIEWRPMPVQPRSLKNQVAKIIHDVLKHEGFSEPWTPTVQWCKSIWPKLDERKFLNSVRRRTG